MRTVDDPSTHLARNPGTGWSVWGQRQAVARLRHAVEQGPTHAYILSGPQQSGKRTASLDFARALSCPNAPGTGDFCGICAVCRRIGKGVFPDVTVFDLASQALRDGDKSRNLTLNIATVREISSAVAYRPTESPWRVIVVDDVETMQETAQEAFLKTLEEPPSYAVLLLLTSDSDSLLPTILSRCVTVRFGLSSAPEIESALEASGVDSKLARRIARVAEGSVGWGLNAALDSSLIESREELVHDATQLVCASPYDRIIGAVLMADEFGNDRERTFNRLEAIQRVWRSALYGRLNLGDVPGAQRQEKGQDGFLALTLDELVRAIRSVDRCVANLEANVRPRLAMESMMLAWPKVRA